MNQELYKFQFQRFSTIEFQDFSELKTNPLEYDDGTPNHPRFKSLKTFYDENNFVKNFGNPMVTVIKEYTLIVVEEKGDKVSLKIFYGHKQRRVGNTWFSKTKNVDYVTVNKKTGNVYHGHLHNYQKKKKFSRVTKMNYFLTEPLKSFSTRIKNFIDSRGSDGYQEATKCISVFLNALDNSNEFQNLDYDERLYKFYLDKKEIKYPNNFQVYKNFYWGPKFGKLLKKNQKKLVETFMDINEIHGKKIKKALHNCTNLNIQLLKQSLNLFGIDWILQDENLVSDLLNSKSPNTNSQDELKKYVTQEELKRIFSMYKQVYIHENLDSYTFADHIRMYVSLRKYGETDLRWMSSDDKGRDFFHQEHIDWSEKIDYYTRGLYERVYPNYFYDMIENPFMGFKPTILNNSSTYNEESSIQHNCVKTYLGRPSSFIISLRKDSGERATLEYKVTKSDKVFVERVQSLGRYNGKLDESWNEALKILDEVVVKVFSNDRFETVKLKKVCANGVELFSDSEFSSDGYIHWTFKSIINDFGFYI